MTGTKKMQVSGKMVFNVYRLSYWYALTLDLTACILRMHVSRSR